MQTNLQSNLSDQISTEILVDPAEQTTAQTGPVELNLSLLTQVAGGVSPYGTW